MSRQLGSALGVAILVAIIGHPAPGELLGAFRDAWTFQIAVALAAGFTLLSVGPVRIGSATVEERAVVEERVPEAGEALAA